MPSCNVPAFPLTSLKFVQGEGFDSLQSLKGKHVVVLERFEDWCGPCVHTIPHLNSLHQQYEKKGLIVVGITTSRDEKAVKAFIHKMGNKMTYRVAIDMNNEMAKYMSHFGAEGIPFAVVVDHKGNIRWSGHPQEGDFQGKIDVLCNEMKMEKAKDPNEEGKEEVNVYSKGSLHYEDVAALSVGDLKWIYKTNGIPFENEVEKGDYVERIVKENGGREIKVRGKRGQRVGGEGLEVKEKREGLLHKGAEEGSLDEATLSSLRSLDVASLPSLSIRELNSLIIQYRVQIPSSGMEKSDLVKAIIQRKEEIQ